MANYAMTCTCGETMAIEAPTREAAVSMLQGGMTQEALDQHFREHHQATDQKPTLEQTKAMIEQTLVAV